MDETLTMLKDLTDAPGVSGFEEPVRRVMRDWDGGDNVKLTISFPGFGQKKMIEKFAKLDKA